MTSLISFDPAHRYDRFRHWLAVRHAGVSGAAAPGPPFAVRAELGEIGAPPDARAAEEDISKGLSRFERGALLQKDPFRREGYLLPLEGR